MTMIVGISGSLRRNTYITGRLRAARAAASAGMTIKLASIAGIPLYDGDFQTEHGVPDSVMQFREAIARAEGGGLVELSGIEPLTSSLRTTRSPN